MTAINLAIFAVIWICTIYVLNCLIARRIKPIKLTTALLYVTSMAMLGVFGEIGFDTLYKAINGRPLWLYHVLPIHDGYTSQYSLFLWGMVGFHIYLLHDTFKARKTLSIHAQALWFCIDAIILEALVNLSFLAAFDDFIYYYLPGDLWHITSLQTLPLYIFAGYVTIMTFRLFLYQRQLFTTFSATFAILLVFFAS